MSVKKEPNGRRSVQVEVEVPGAPEDVWAAIATGPGVSAWFVATEFVEEGGQPVRVKSDFGPGMESEAVITKWRPPQMFAAESPGWGGSPPMATEWHVEAKAGGVCLVRVVHSLFASTDDWDNQLEGTEYGWPAFFRTLRIYLGHFRGQRSIAMKWMVPIAGTEADAWEALTTALGAKGVIAGQSWASAGDVPTISGVVEFVSQSPPDILMRIDQPGPGVAALGAYNCGGPSLAALNFYLYGDDTAAIVEREKPVWDAWFAKHFPTPTEASQ